MCNYVTVEINECANTKPTRLTPSPAEDQWLVVEMCKQEVTNCKSKAMQILLVITMCVDPLVVISDVLHLPITQEKTLPCVKNDNKDEDCDDDYINNYYYYCDDNDGDDDAQMETLTN